MSLPLTHAGLSAPGISAALDLKFASTLSLTSSSGITPSFSRASSGTYFGSDGLLKYASINLITYSEDFSNAAWTKSGVTISTNSATAPDGKTTADTLTENSANATHFFNKASSTLAGTVYTSSIYAKAGTRKYIDVTSVAQDGGIYRRFNNVFDLETGTWQSTASLNSPANTAYSITSVGNGWYRISSSILAYGSTHYLVVYLSNSANPTRDASNDVVYTGNGTGNFYIWGAQLEASSTVGTYCPTTSSANSAPRFDHTYNGTSWVSKGLLVEEQRTNLLVDSSNFSGWGTASTTLTLNDTTSPDGSINATKIASTGSFYPSCFKSVSVTSNTKYTASVFAKAGNRNYLSIEFRGGGTSPDVAFDILNGSVVYGSGKIEDVGNGWYRCSFSKDSIDTSELVIISMMSPSNPSPGDYIYIFGAQLEAGAFPTSYIPTTSASATRSADVCQIAGTDFSGFWNASEGSTAVEFDTFVPISSTGYPFIFEFDNGSTTANRIANYLNIAGNKIDLFVSDSSAASSTVQALNYPAINTATKTASCFKLNDIALTANGGAVVTDSSQNMPTETRLSIGSSIVYGTYYINGHIARLRYFNKRLTNQQLEDICKPEQQLKLDLNFSSSLSLTPTVGPTPSFSRASTGSYFDSTGTLRYANVNLINYSEDITNSSAGNWTDRTNVTTSGNQGIAPDGSSTADLLTPTTTGVNIFGTALKSITFPGSGTVSVYAKASGKNWIRIWNANGGFPTWFNLSAGTIGTIGSGVAASIQNVGNGWYRCVCSTANLSNGSGYVYVGVADADNSGSATASGTDGVLVWGAQLETGTTATVYSKTTTSASAAPRFDYSYNGTSWVSKGLLVEEQRTNSLLQSNSFNTTWVLLDGAVVANSGTSPDGTNNAWKLNELATTTASHGIYQATTIPGGSCTWSIFAKAGERNWLQFVTYNSSTNFFTWFNLANGTVGTNAAGNTAAITPVGNGWYKCSITRSAGSTYAQFFTANSDNNGSYLGEVGKGIYIYGAQVETGAFPTSYIPTTTAAVTRSADVCQITGTDFSGFYNQTEGSFVAEYDIASILPTSTVFYANDGTVNNSFRMYSSSGAGIEFYSRTAAVSDGIITLSTTPPSSAKVAIGTRLNDMAGSLNGASVVTDTVVAMPPGLNRLDLGVDHTASRLNGHISRLRYYAIRQSNANLRYLSGGSKSFQPDNISGIQFWVDASDSTTLYQDSALTTLAVSDGDPIGGWKDKSAYNRSALQTDGTRKPLLKTGLQNGRSIIRTDGVNDNLLISTISIPQPYQVFFVCKISSTGNIFHGSGQGQVRTGNASLITPLTSVAAFSGAVLTATSFFSSGVTLLGEYVANGTNSKIYKNSVLSASGNAGTQGVTSNFSIGAYNTPQAFVSMDMCELIIYGSELSASDRKSVEVYLNSKWSIY